MQQYLLHVQKNAKGIALVASITAVVYALNHFTSTPLMITALVLGIALNSFYKKPIFKSGIAFTGRTILRIGVALLGLRISLGQIMDLGLNTVLLAITLTTLTILTTIYVARLIKSDSTTGTLIGGAVGICGASAALAISAVLPNRKGQLEQTTLCTIICVNILSTIAMVAYPIIAEALNFTSFQTGIVFGLTIHDVAQVVGAGASVSDPVTDTAVISKLLRVSFLSVVVVMVSLAYRKESKVSGVTPPVLPMFLVIFLGFVILNSLGYIPDTVSAPLVKLSKILLVSSIVALGMKTQLSDLKTVGYKPILLSIYATAFIAIAGFIAISHI